VAQQSWNRSLASSYTASEELLKVLDSSANVVTTTKSPLHPAARATRRFGYDGADTLRIRFGVAPVGLIETKLREDGRSVVRTRWIRKVHCAVSIVVIAGPDVVARAGTILVVVDFVDNLLLEGVRCGSECLAIVCLVLDEVCVVEIVVEPGEEDQGIRVVAVHSFCGRYHVLDPGVPGVWQGFAGGLAKLVAEADGC
jgi:hypothetical protein